MIELHGARREPRVAKGFSVDAILLGDPHRDVTNRLVAVVERTRERVRHAASVVAHDTCVGDDRLVSHLGAIVAERALEPLGRAPVADLAQRGDGHLAHVGIVVLDGHEQPREGFDPAQVCQRDRGLRPHRGRRIAAERLLEERERAGPRLVRVKRVTHDVSDRRDTGRCLLRRKVAKRGLEVAW